MDPSRRAMLASTGSGRRDIASPRADPDTRVTKVGQSGAPSKTAQNAARYLSSDEQSRQFVAEEDKFVLKQSKKKADIRVREGRAMPVDSLAFNLRFIDKNRDVFDDQDADVDVELKQPVELVESLNVAQLAELDTGIRSFLALEGDQVHRQYWEGLQTICADQKSNLDPYGRNDQALRVVAANIDKILHGKTYERLELLETQVNEKIRSNEVIDNDYWEQLLANIVLRKAKAQVEKIFQTVVEARDKLAKELEPSRKPVSTAAGASTATTATAAEGQQAAVMTAFSAVGNEDVSLATKALYDREAAQGLLENEELFTAEADVPSAKKPAWAGQYRARKPKYFNRVQMGYDWNKYNQTHFDHDNPPPKVVQGYRFNLFYPDLVDKTKAPTYKIFREGGRRAGESFAPAGEEDTCLVIFIAGPPYEEIAFRVVDRPWDFSAKRDRGFKSAFDKGILQLHFNFKKIFYRK
ncbi:hypothetical protein DCS_04498 [Drechmeria coniospora]|uniref:Splicing factor Cactin n=1 Tax=Drechmeria coniospora TaxID=98403 RepID=A0A151GK69_DRECN|nr:hypothetical protein DCS_04498 [Drechmeria coniospora]KYK57488.1 hypothetical protein DCS_04498 [Drechmeria coniospora]